MPTPRQSIKKANDSIEKDLYDLEVGSIPNDIRENRIKNNLNNVKRSIAGNNNENEQMLSV